MYHQVKYSIRRIQPAELPTVTDMDGTVRPATAHELLNAGIAHLQDDFYSCIHQEHRDPDTLVWSVHGTPLPGIVVSEGSHAQRHAQMAEVAGHVTVRHQWAGESMR